MFLASRASKMQIYTVIHDNTHIVDNRKNNLILNLFIRALGDQHSRMLTQKTEGPLKIQSYADRLNPCTVTHSKQKWKINLPALLFKQTDKASGSLCGVGSPSSSLLQK